MARSIGHHMFNPLEAELAALRARVSRLEEQTRGLEQALEAARLQRDLTGS